MNLEEGLYSGEKGPERTDTGKKTGIWGELKNVFNINKSFFLEKFSFKELYMLGKYIISECKKCKDPEYKKCKEGKLQEEEIQKEYRDFISFLIQKYNLRLVNYDVESLIIDVKDNELVIKQGSKEFIIREGTKPLKLEDFSFDGLCELGRNINPKYKRAFIRSLIQKYNLRSINYDAKNLEIDVNGDGLVIKQGSKEFIIREKTESRKLEELSFDELYKLGKFLISEYKKHKEGKSQEDEILERYRDFVNFLIQKYNLRSINYDAKNLEIDVEDNELVISLGLINNNVEDLIIDVTRNNNEFVIKRGSREFIINNEVRPLELKNLSFKELYELGAYIISEYEKYKEGESQEDEILKKYKGFIIFLIQKYNLRSIDYKAEDLKIEINDNELVIKQGNEKFIIREETESRKLEELSFKELYELVTYIISKKNKSTSKEVMRKYLNLFGFLVDKFKSEFGDKGPFVNFSSKFSKLEGDSSKTSLVIYYKEYSGREKFEEKELVINEESFNNLKVSRTSIERP